MEALFSYIFFMPDAPQFLRVSGTMWGLDVPGVAVMAHFMAAAVFAVFLARVFVLVFRKHGKYANPENLGMLFGVGLMTAALFLKLIVAVSVARGVGAWSVDVDIFVQTLQFIGIMSILIALCIHIYRQFAQ